MKIIAIYGSQGKGSTYNCVQILIEAMKQQGEIEIVEFTLPRDMPHFCIGCFACFLNGEDKCPHKQYVQPIVQALREADGIILSSPVYACEVTGAMKAFIDHLCYMWMPHRPMEEMFSKVAMVISTTAGKGTKTSMKTMAKSLNYWGVKRVYSYGTAVAATCWHEVKDKKKVKINRSLERKAKTFYQAINDRKKLRTRLFTKIIFALMRGMLSKFEEGHKDRGYWEAMGWLGKKKPYL